MAGLGYVSESKLQELRESIDRNLERYRETGFADVANGPGWWLELDRRIDLSGLADLDGSSSRADADLRNTRIVARVLGGLSSSLANEEQIWVRLTHVDAFEYTRDRWLRPGDSEEAHKKAILKHFFARGQNGIRDDNAVSRLWWNAHIVRLCYPQDFERGLELLLKSADIRSNLVERSWLMGRRGLAAAVFRGMDRDPFVAATEETFRAFMKSLNLLGGGVVFEGMEDSAMDEFLSRCVEHAQRTLAIS